MMDDKTRELVEELQEHYCTPDPRTEQLVILAADLIERQAAELEALKLAEKMKPRPKMECLLYCDEAKRLLAEMEAIKP